MLSVLNMYLGLLPQNSAQAWQLLTPAQQARSGGFDAYQKTWHSYRNVQLDGAAPHGANSLLARVKLEPVQGTITDDVYDVQFVSQNGSVLINGFAVVGKPNRHG
jgi:hypothetical protein